MSLELVGSLVERYQHSLSDVSSRLLSLSIAIIGEGTVGGTIYSVKSQAYRLCQLFPMNLYTCLAPGKHFSVDYLLILKLITAKLTFVLCVLVCMVSLMCTENNH